MTNKIAVKNAFLPFVITLYLANICHHESLGHRQNENNIFSLVIVYDIFVFQIIQDF